LQAAFAPKVIGTARQADARLGAQMPLEGFPVVADVTHDAHEAACLGDRVLIFSGRPGRIRAEIHVDLPRPRDIGDARVAEYATRITAQLGRLHDQE